MNRRDFLKRMAAAGLVAAAPKIIFDIGAHSYKQPFTENWHWTYPRRFKLVNGEFQEVFPVRQEVCWSADANKLIETYDYKIAQYEEVLLIGKHPFITEG